MRYISKKNEKLFSLARLASAVLTLALLFSSSINVFAQNGAVVTGRVTDERGANITGAEVRLRSRVGTRLFARTDESGVYTFKGLAPGDYILEVTARGFAALTSTEFRVERGETASRDLTLPVAAVNENVVVTATGTPQRADEVSKSVTLLEEDQIETRREITLPEALRGTPGLRVQQQGSPGALTSLRLRGLRNFDTALLLDGLRVRDASDINGSALPYFTDLMPVSLDRVEILRGSGSSIYGTNAIGGVINLVPKTGTGHPTFEAGFEGGSLALFRERLQGSGGLGERAGFSFGLSRVDVRHGVDGQDQYGNTAGGGRFQFNATPSITISANFFGTLSNARVNHSPRALAGAFATTEQYPEAIEGVTFQPDFNDPDQGRRNRLLVGSVRWAQRVNEAFSYTVAYQRVSTNRRNYNGPEIDPQFASFFPFGDFEFATTNNGTTDTIDARSNIQLGRSNLATVGFEYERESLFQETTTAFGVTGGTTDRQRTFAFFAQDQIFLLDDRLQISLGMRGQYYRIRAADRPGFLAGVTPEKSLTGDGAIAYFIPSTGTKLRAHVGNGFRAPSLFQRFGEGTFDSAAGFSRFGDPTLRAEQSIGVDGGFDQRLASDRLRFGVTYFYTRLQRVIDFMEFEGFFTPTAPPDPLGLGREFGYVNLPGGLARGVESYVEAAPRRGMEVRASYTYTNSDRFAPSAGLQREFVIPTHLFGLTFNQRYRSLLFSFDLNYTSSHIAPIGFPAVILTFKGYTKADAFATYERTLNDRVTVILFGGAENLFDEDYFENGFRAPGIMGRGGVNFRF
jgi:vitamin B12 transporter